MVKIRTMNRSDIPKLDVIWKKYYASDFSLPDLTNSVTFAVVEDDNGNITGFGIVKVFAEAIMILDKERSDRVKTLTMKELLDKAENDSKNNHITQLHSFCKDEEFANILIKHFDFKKIETIGLIKDL